MPVLNLRVGNIGAHTTMVFAFLASVGSLPSHICRPIKGLMYKPATACVVRNTRHIEQAPMLLAFIREESRPYALVIAHD